jgi:hypothetical protein
MFAGIVMDVARLSTKFATCSIVGRSLSGGDMNSRTLGSQSCLPNNKLIFLKVIYGLNGTLICSERNAIANVFPVKDFF